MYMFKNDIVDFTANYFVSIETVFYYRVH